MPVGPMQFGTLNVAGLDETTLRANHLSATLSVENPTADVIAARGGDVGVRASANPDSELGVAVLGQEGRSGVFGIGRTRGVLGDSFSNRRGWEMGYKAGPTFKGRNGVFGHHFGAGVGVRALCNARFGVFGRAPPSIHLRRATTREWLERFERVEVSPPLEAETPPPTTELPDVHSAPERS